MVAAQWDDTCDGGGRSSHTPNVPALLFIGSLIVWWSSEHTYKNAITNELFLLTSAEAYLRTKNTTYLENARKVRAIVFHCVCDDHLPAFTRNTLGVRLWPNRD